MTRDEFVELCAKLRGLGATKVSAEGFSAEFVPVAGSAIVPDPNRRQSRKEEKPPPTREEANAARRARELGR